MASNQNYPNRPIECFDISRDEKEESPMNIEYHYTLLNPMTPVVQKNRDQSMFSPSQLEVERIALIPGSPPAKGMSPGVIVGTTYHLEYNYTPLKSNAPAVQKTREQKMFSPNPLDIEKLFDGLSPRFPGAMTPGAPIKTSSSLEYNYTPLKSNAPAVQKTREQKMFSPNPHDIEKLFDGLSPRFPGAMTPGAPIETSSSFEWSPIPLEPRSSEAYKTGGQNSFQSSSIEMRRLLGELSPGILPAQQQEETIPIEYEWSPIPLEPTASNQCHFFPSCVAMKTLLNSMLDEEMPEETDRSVEK